MPNLAELLVVSAAMGLSIFLSLPLVLSRRMTPSLTTILSAVAIGILLFLMGDIYSDVAPLIAASQPYLTLPSYDAIFLLGAGGAFLLLFAAEHRPRRRGTFSPRSMALVVALAIGFQNLTEGLLFGSLWAAGTWAGYAFFSGLLAVVFVGFFIQNITEGFPIVAPLLGAGRPAVGTVAGFFTLGGVPTILGALIGFYGNSAPLDVFFESIAIGAILYALLPMLRVAFRPAEPPMATFVKQRLTYLGVLAGFLLGFLVNAF